MKLGRQLALLAFALTATVASLSSPVSAQAAKPKAVRPRVFFIEPKNGATVTSPVHLKFGIANYQIEAVPQGDVKTSRPGVGHYHIGIDQNCLPAGTTIVKGTPSWVHFGDGKSEIDMQLPPGRHKLALEIGDDLHMTRAGLCTTIAVDVSK